MLHVGVADGLSTSFFIWSRTTAERKGIEKGASSMDNDPGSVIDWRL